MRRQTPFADIVRHLTPFFVSRQVVVGAGRVGIGQDGRQHGFQISQRADFFEVEVGLETTLKRPIINTRDEPHADPERYRRLHVIIGDANMSEVSTYLKVGTTALVLAMIEERWFAEPASTSRSSRRWQRCARSRTTRRCKHQLTLRDGRQLTAVQLQMEYLEQARKFVEDRYGADADEQTARRARRGGSACLTRLDRRPDVAVARARLGREARAAAGLSRSRGPRLGRAQAELVDLQYSDVRQDKGLYNRLVARGRMERIVSDAEIDRAVTEPPMDTRAYFRGRCLSKYADEVAAASWDSVIFDVGRESLQRVPMLEPLRGTKAHVEDLLARCSSASQLVDELSGRN